MQKLSHDYGYKLPTILPCACCNSVAKLDEDWDFRDTWRVECQTALLNKCKNTMVGYNISCNRAIQKWNNQQNLIKKIQNNEKIEIRLCRNRPTSYMKRMFKLVPYKS